MSDLRGSHSQCPQLPWKCRNQEQDKLCPDTVLWQCLFCVLFSAHQLPVRCWSVRVCVLVQSRHLTGKTTPLLVWKICAEQTRLPVARQKAAGADDCQSHQNMTLTLFLSRIGVLFTSCDAPVRKSTEHSHSKRHADTERLERPARAVLVR